MTPWKLLVAFAITTAFVLPASVADENPPELPCEDVTISEDPRIGVECPNPDLAPILDLVPDVSEYAEWSTLELLTPIDGTEVSGTVILRGTTEANEGFRVSYVGIWLNGQFAGRASGTTDWTFSLDTALLVDGEHEIEIASMAAPDAPASPVTLGWDGVNARFTSTNAAVGVALLEEEFETPSENAARAWTIPIAEDYTGLRFTIEVTPTDGSVAPAATQVTVIYTGTGGGAPQAWTLSQGILNGGAAIVRAPYGTLQAPGTLVVDGAFAGDAAVRILVEGLAVGGG